MILARLRLTLGGASAFQQEIPVARKSVRVLMFSLMLAIASGGCGKKHVTNDRRFPRGLEEHGRRRRAPIARRRRKRRPFDPGCWWHGVGPCGSQAAGR